MAPKRYLTQIASGWRLGGALAVKDTCGQGTLPVLFSRIDFLMKR
jgi:hypothetical protein